MKQNHGKGVFGFLAGVTAGGIVALLTSKRKGSDVRKDLAKEWSAGGYGSDTLRKELTGMAQGVRDIWDDVTSTPQFKKASKDVQKRFTDARTRAEELIADAEERAVEYKDDALDKAEKLRKDAQKKASALMEDAKAAIMKEEKHVKKAVKKTVKKASAKASGRTSTSKKSAK